MVQEVLQNFETRALKMRSSVAHHQKLTRTNWEPSSKLILLKLQEKLPQNSSVDNFEVMWHLKQIGKVKKFDKWVPHEQIKKLPFWSVVFSYSIQQWAVSWSDCDVWWKSGFRWQPTMASWWLDWKEAPNHFPKLNLYQESWLLFCDLLPSDPV